MVKIIPKEKEVAEKEPIWVALLFWFSLFILMVAICLFFVFRWEAKKAETQLEKVNTQLEQLETSEKKALKEAIYDYKKRIDDFPVLLSAHQTPSKIFTLLEENVHPHVWFSGIKFIRNKNYLDLSGKAENLLSLAQQILIFEKLPQVKELTVSNIKSDKEGKINFNLKIVLNPTFLLLK